MSLKPHQLSARVAAALAEGQPVVALESTIITHGMPYPQNVETARGVEAVVREEGAEPATIAVVDGTLRIGLEDAEIEALAKAGDVMKLSRADLAFAMANRQRRAVAGAEDDLLLAADQHAQRIGAAQPVERRLEGV